MLEFGYKIQDIKGMKRKCLFLEVSPPPDVSEKKLNKKILPFLRHVFIYLKIIWQARKMPRWQIECTGYRSHFNRKLLAYFGALQFYNAFHK